MTSVGPQGHRRGKKNTDGLANFAGAISGVLCVWLRPALESRPDMDSGRTDVISRH